MNHVVRMAFGAALSLVTVLSLATPASARHRHHHHHGRHCPVTTPQIHCR